MKNSIFVQIASYRDSECRLTIDDLFEKADHPEKIFVGLVWQYAEEDNYLPFYPDRYDERVRILHIPHTEARGVCWARHTTQTLYDGEEFTLQIDAHMRFKKSWDTLLLIQYRQLQRSGITKPVLSHYPPNYTPEGEFSDVLKIMVPIVKEEDRLILYRRSGHEIDHEKGEPVLSAFMSACFFFAHASCIEEVPYDPYIYFLGEEITLTLRFWTRGWDIFNPGQILLYHLYKNVVKEGKTKKTRKIILHQQDHHSVEINRLSKIRVRHLLGIDLTSEKKSLKELDKYGLGTDRSVYQYERFSGVNFKSLTRRVFTRTGLFNRQRIPLGRQPEQQLMEQVAQDKKKSVLTLGSDFFNGLKPLNIKSLLHVGCGKTELYPLYIPDDISYTGIDYSQKSADVNRLHYRHCPNIEFSSINYFAEPLPRRNSILFEEFCALPLPAAWNFLEQAVQSRAQYIALRFPEKDVLPFEAPFFLPQPLFTVSCGMSQSVHIWQAQSLAVFSLALDEPEAKYRKQLIENIQVNLHRLKRVFSGYEKGVANLIESMPVQSRSEVVGRIRNERTNAILAKNPVEDRIVNATIDLRFCIFNENVMEVYPFAQEEYRVLGMTLICEFFENLAQQLS